jgi:Uma2 family endonuclease
MSTALSLGHKLMTAEEFFEWANRPENEHRSLELERGEVIEVPQPGRRHGLVCGNAGGLLRDYTIRRKKGYVCTNDTGVIVERAPDTVRGVDVALYDDVAKYEDVPTKLGETIPKLAVEVLSPSDRWSRTIRRITELLRRGVALVWLVDPEGRDVTVYRAGRDPSVFSENDEIAGEEVLPDIRFRVADFFKMPGE